MGDAIVGVVANPLSGRDIRRLVTQASVFPTAEKANMIQRMLTAFGAVGVHRVLLSTDLGGISAAVFRAIERRPPAAAGPDARWPEVEFLDGQPIRQTAQDTVDAVRRMVTAGARVIVCLGGDGTARVAASAAGDVPMLALSTGTNNVFPAVREATIAGLAAGLVATGAVPADSATTRAKLLEVAGRRTGPRPRWSTWPCPPSATSGPARSGIRPRVTQLFCAFAEPDAIGLSSILGQLSPVARREPHGVTARLAADAPRQVLAPDRAGSGRAGRGARDRADAPRIRLPGRRAGRRHRRRRRAGAHLRAGRAAHRPAARRRAAVRGRARGPGRERPPRPAQTHPRVTRIDRLGGVT